MKTNTFLQFTRSNEMEKNDSKHVHDMHSVQQHVMLEGKILIDKTAFVGHSFSEKDVEVVSFFKEILAEMSVKCLSGEKAEAKSISDKVKERIQRAELFIGIFTQAEKIEGKDEWSTSSWVIEEKAYAQTLGKKLILIKENGISQIGGMQGDYEYVSFNRNELHKAAIKLMQMIWSINPGKINMSRNGPVGISNDLLRTAIESQPQEPGLRLMLAQQEAAAGRIDAALREIESVLSKYPNYLPARLELIKGWMGLGKIDESLLEVERILKSNPFDSNAHHQMGHILERKQKLIEAENAFRKAIDCNPGDPNNYKCLGMLIFRTAEKNVTRLKEAQELFDMQIEIGGPKEKEKIQPYLLSISSRLKASPNRDNTPKTKKGRK
jgi:tetratricopeptide (TPR) repeat protein